jgi:hypothetical protein
VSFVDARELAPIVGTNLAGLELAVDVEAIVSLKASRGGRFYAGVVAAWHCRRLVL